MHDWYSLKHLFIFLALLMLVLGFIYAAAVVFGHSQTQQQPPAVSNGLPPSAPAPTVADVVTAQHGFQYLVQYTTSGLHPSSLTMKQGETVRFTNTTNDSVQITGATQSPTLAQGNYWEYTPLQAGTVVFTAHNSSSTITVIH